MIGAHLAGRYEILKLQQEGRLFALYGARDHTESKDVSVRVLQPPCSEEAAYLERLGHVVAKVSSVAVEGLDRIHRLERDQGAAFLVGDVVKGSPLSDRLRKLGSFSVPVATSMGIAVGEVLGSLHKAEIVHGDLGAHTVHLLADGSVRVQAAGLWEACSASQSAGALVLPATAPYLAPEVAAGAMPSPKSDVYALGVLLFELVSGRLPYIADHAAGFAEKHAAAPVPSLRLFNPSVPIVLDEIIRKAMAKGVAERYRNVGEMVADLKTLQDALRFGRSLTWPLRPEAAAPPQPVAPKLSAVREERREVFDHDSGEVPMWIKVSIAFFSALLVFMIGGWIVFNFNKPREVVLPNLVGQSVAEANAMLSGLNLRLRIGSKESSETVAADRIMDMNPAAKERMREGAFVNVTVSLGSKFVEVPDLRGMTVDQARALLGTVNLDLSDNVQEVPDRSIERGMIVGQLPGPHNKVERFTAIRVRVSSGRGGETSGEGGPRFEYTMRIRVSDVPVPVTVRIDMTDAEGTRTVYEEFHEPDDVFSVAAEGVGEEVLFRIFYDGELVKQVPMKPKEQNP